MNTHHLIIVHEMDVHHTDTSQKVESQDRGYSDSYARKCMLPLGQTDLKYMQQGLCSQNQSEERAAMDMQQPTG